MKKSFEFWLYDQNDAVIIVFMFDLSKIEDTIEEWSSKQGTIYSDSF